MKVSKSHTTARAGIAVVQTIITKLGWLFREQPISDFGIDAEIEVVLHGHATGRLIAAQIKSGSSYFRKATTLAFRYRGKLEHLEYWLNHSLPVVVILHDPETDHCYWEEVSARTVNRGLKEWDLMIPKSQTLGPKTARRLALLSEGSPYILRLRGLQLAKPYMEQLEQGTLLLLQVEEWVNKTSGRGDFTLIAKEPTGEEQVLMQWPFVLVGLTPYEEALPALFPWADLTVEEETYEDHDRQRWDLECGMWDQEEGDYIGHTMNFDEWANCRARGLRPYCNNGEVAYWRLELTLNDLGRSFLKLNRFLEGDRDVDPTQML